MCKITCKSAKGSMTCLNYGGYVLDVLLADTCLSYGSPTHGFIAHKLQFSWSSWVGTEDTVHLRKSSRINLKKTHTHTKNTKQNRKHSILMVPPVLCIKIH